MLLAARGTEYALPCLKESIMPESRQQPIAVLIAGDPVPSAQRLRGDFGQMIRNAVGGAWTGKWLQHDLRSEQPLPAAQSLAAVIVSGSAASLTEKSSWMERGLSYLHDLVRARVPVLGICFGHQMLGEALGGRVAANPLGREVGTVELTDVKADDLLGTGWEQGLLEVNSTHVDSVVELPANARVSARTRLEQHAVVRFAERAWGVQFHPEFDGEVMRCYIRERRDAIAAEGHDVEALLAASRDTPDGRSILARFIEAVVLSR